MILIALGANLPSKFGSARFTLRRAMSALESAGLRIKAKSSIYLTAPVPVSDQPWYHNAVVSVEADMSAEKLLQILHDIENHFGRTRSVKNEARVLDLDLLDYHGAVSSLKGLELPHPRLSERAFVLYPLHEIVPNWIHVVSKLTVSQLIDRLPDGQEIRRDTLPEIMGIINVTPDSFSDGGKFISSDKAIEHGLRLKSEGAVYLDIGGESTRPGSSPLGPQEELARILPVIRGLKDCGAVLSVDTRHAVTMEAVLAEGVTMINDVTALEGDARSLSILAAAEGPVCLMHMQGTPQTMQVEPHYDDVVVDIRNYLKDRIDVCVKTGISIDRLIVDPGIGFGKTLDHNMELMRRLSEFTNLGAAVLLGASRKSFISKLMKQDVPVSERLGGSLAVVGAAMGAGVDIVRVHDVAATKQFMTVKNRLTA